ncbi:arrestin domain-containing protein 3 [Musca vetustissima]|uniref:arrestin domain-containing protein 3 n=1 Tax=Musca vetustissima TaxID=27455 RepID=UPI002AB6D813|nr:arrestin domain-containing protein 3 [Musca vetustissima]
MPTTCEFELDRINPIYSSGEYINGRILLRTEKIKRVNAVYVTLEGEAKVQWSISGRESASYCGHQQYLYSRANVFDNSDFAAGLHVYVLTLRIPPDCPSSCKGPYGYIAYNISLVIDKQRTFDEVFRKPICVVQTLDLNFHPEYALPVKAENVKYLCQWPCTSGPLCFSLMLPYAGFVPGQHIKYFLELDNQSPHYDIVGVEASLKQHYVFLARKPMKRNFHTKTLVKSSIEESTLRLTKRLYEGTLYVPNDIPRSTLNLNYIVFIHYMLQVKLKTGVFHYDTDISVPVIIGTEPLRQFQEEQQRLRRNYNRNCNICTGSNSSNRSDTASNHSSGSGNLVTTQPTMRLRRELEELLESQEQEEEEVMSGTHLKDCLDDEPPSYDSCLPPSFSFATTMGSQAAMEVSEIKRTEQQRINIQLPQFPGYNTFNSHTQSPCYPSDSLLEDEHFYNSCRSLMTDRTGRSLDTLDVLSNEEHEEGDDGNGDANDDNEEENDDCDEENAEDEEERAENLPSENSVDDEGADGNIDEGNVQLEDNNVAACEVVDGNANEDN